MFLISIFSAEKAFVDYVFFSCPIDIHFTPREHKNNSKSGFSARFGD